MKALLPCAYCGKRPGKFVDHLITKAQARRRPRALINRDDPRFKVPACRECNEAKGTRLRVPASRAHLIPQLQRITGNVYAVWQGDAEGLRGVVK